MINKFLGICALTLFVLSACSDTDKASVIWTNFEEEVPLRHNFEFQFDRDLATDDLINTILEKDLLEFYPPVSGKYSWSSSDVLVFRPDSKLDPATDYKVKISKVLSDLIPESVDRSWTKSFHTPYLSVNSFEGYWGENKNNASVAGMYLALSFNHKVDPNDLVGKLKVTVDDVDQSYVVNESNTTRDVNIYIPNIKPEDRKYEIKLNISSELKPARGSVGIGKDLEYVSYLNSPYIIEITGVRTEHNGTQGTIFIATSQKVLEEDFKKKFSFLEENIKYSVEIDDMEVRVISKEFDSEKIYDIEIEKGLKGVFDGELKQMYERSVSFAKVRPTIAFLDSKNIYLSANGKRNIEVNIVNVDELTMKVYKIYENNIIQFLGSNGYYYDDYYEEYYDEYDEYSGDNNNVNQMGDLVYEEKIDTDKLKSKGANKLLNINFNDKINNDGIYQIILQSKEDYWVSAKKVLSVSDIGLIVKKGPRSISVFANSIESAEAMADVEVKLIGRNNQILTELKTDKDGLAVFDFDKLPADNFDLDLVTAKFGDDYNYMYLQKSQVDITRYDIGGYREDPSGLMTYVYPERDIYRPGEKLNVSAIIRDYQWETPKSYPVKFKLTSPNGTDVGTVRAKLNTDGGAEASFQLSTSSPTGSYMITVLSANDLVLNNSYIRVEEFVPDRIKVSTSKDAEEYAAGDDVALSIEARNLFGTPASNRNWESEMQLRRAYFYSKDFSDYNFSLDQNQTYFDNGFESGETMDDGTAEASFSISAEYANMGKLSGSIFTTVFDETGRPVNRYDYFTVHTQDTYYGIKNNGYYHKTKHEVETKLIAVDTGGKVLGSSKVEVTLIRHEYSSVLSSSGSYYRYRSVPKEVILDEKVMTLSGAKNIYRFTPDLSGRYEIRLSKPGVSNYVSTTYYCYGWGNTTNSSFKIDNEGNIEVKLDKEEYAVGDVAKVLMTTPFSGKVLVTVESDKVVKHFYQQTDKKSLAFDLRITEDMLPNVYISATLFRPHAVSELPLTVAHGFAPVIVKDQGRNIPIEIEAVEKSRSKTKQKIVLKGKPNSSMTVAVVDEGILQITGFKTPNPFDYFYQKRALGMSSHDVYPYLFPEVSSHSGRPGGGDGGGDAKRLNPMTNKRFSLVSYWSGILHTDKNGRVEYEIDIPQFSGSLRIMAVDYKAKSFGSAEKSMIVADPIVLSAGIPRFLSPGDTLVMPLTITNTTDKSASAITEILLEGPLTLLDSDDNKLSLNANSEGRKVFKIVVGNALGESKIIVKVKSMGETFTHETNISVRPASPLQKRSGSGSILSGKSEVLKMDTKDFLEKTIGKKLVISRSPLVKFTKDIDYLIGYPHGCVEQTVSRAFPQLYFEDMIKDMGIYSDNTASARHNVQQAIVRLQTMQIYNGGYSYWPGHGTASWWGSVLATHFLVEADKAGYEVPETMLSLSLDFISMRIKNRSYEDYYYNGYQKRKIIPKSALYSTYILALANRADKSMMNYYKSNLKDLALDSKYLLAGAFQLIGDQKSFYEILPKAFEGEKSEQSTGGSFYSYVRDEAISLNVLLETDPENPQINYLAKHVSEQLSNKRYLNTQERLFGFLAMGKLAKRNAGNKVTADIKVAGKSIYTFNGKTKTLVDDKLLEGELEITTRDQGELYYFWETEGVDVNGNYDEEDSFLQVRKTFYSRDGRRINNGQFEQNDLIIVKLSIYGLTKKYVENVVISDVLPAGFEIENSRLNDLPVYDWIKDKTHPNYEDIRDDRINLYVDVSHSNRNYYYMVRAVSPGTYFMGPVGADAMYDGEYHSYSGAGWISISE